MVEVLVGGRSFARIWTPMSKLAKTSWRSATGSPPTISRVSRASSRNSSTRTPSKSWPGSTTGCNRQASVIDERVDRINDALGAVPYNPGRYIRLEKEPTTNQDVAQFRADLRNLTNDSLAVDGDQYSEQRFLDVKRIIERFRGRDGYAESDKTLDTTRHRRA